MSEDQKKFGQWARSPKSDLARNVSQTGDHLRKLARPRLERERKHMMLYNPDPSGELAMDFVAWLKREWPQFNMVKQGVDTMTAQVGTKRYMPRYLVNEGSFDLQRKSRLCRRVMEGQVHDLRLATIMRDAFRSGASRGMEHVLATLDHKNEPMFEQCLPGTVFVDPYTTMRGKATMAIVRRPYGVDEALDRFAGAKAEDFQNVRTAESEDRALFFLPRDNMVVGQPIVYEAWQAPAGGRKGRHVVCTSRAVIIDEDWDEPVPLIKHPYLKREVGYWGVGLGEIGADEQAHMDRTLARLEDCETIESTIYAMLAPNQRMKAERQPGEPVRILRVNGPFPTLQTFSANSANLAAKVDRIRERFLAVTGISAMAAENKKPAGVNSGVAQDTYEDISQQRYADVNDNAKDAWQDAIEWLARLNARAQKASKGSYSVTARTSRGSVPLVRTVKWADAQLEAEQYRLSLQLVSETPYKVGGRYAALAEFIAGGFVHNPYGQKQMLDTPDESLNQLETVQLDYVFWQVERILDGEGADVVLDPRQHADTVSFVVSGIYLHVKMGGAPEDVLQQLQKLDDAAKSKLEEQKAAAQAQQPMAVAPGAPPAGQQGMVMA